MYVCSYQWQWWWLVYDALYFAVTVFVIAFKQSRAKLYVCKEWRTYRPLKKLFKVWFTLVMNDSCLVIKTLTCSSEEIMQQYQQICKLHVGMFYDWALRQWFRDALHESQEDHRFRCLKYLQEICGRATSLDNTDDFIFCTLWSHIVYLKSESWNAVDLY